jgi:hypothetical protein
MSMWSPCNHWESVERLCRDIWIHQLNYMLSPLQHGSHRHRSIKIFLSRQRNEMNGLSGAHMGPHGEAEASSSGIVITVTIHESMNGLPHAP